VYLEWFSLTNYHGSTTGGVIIIIIFFFFFSPHIYKEPFEEPPAKFCGG